jgi:hypothetical protein
MSTDKIVRRLLLGLLGKRRRRIPILYRWNLHSAPCKGTSLEEVVANFVYTLLYEPLTLEMTHEALYPWGHVRGGLSIPFSWLNSAELQSVREMHRDRLGLFRTEKRLPKDASQFLLSNYMHPLSLSEQHRRELVRDFVGLCWIQKDEKIRNALCYAILKALHGNLHAVSMPVDQLIVPLIRFMEGNCKFDNILAI